jgi:AcrR family transcriptional regulator
LSVCFKQLLNKEAEMPRGGVKTRPRTVTRTADTRSALVDAAVASLIDDGYAASSARSIAQRAGVTQALVFYHFGSVVNLLLAALDKVSAQRMEVYEGSVDNATSAGALLSVATGIFVNDLERGYVKVLAEMIAGSSASPELRREVWDRVEPWLGFTQRAVRGVAANSGLAGILPADDVAYAIVAMYLGLELLTHLHGDREPAIRLLEHAARLATLLGAVVATGGAE